MPSHSEGLGIWLSVWRFLLIHCLYERAAKVLARLRGCAGSPEPSLLAQAISTKFAWRSPHAINSHVLTGTNPCINKAIHVLLMHGFVVLRISIPGPSQNLTLSSVTCTVANVILWRQNKAIICPGNGIFNTFAGNVPFRAIIGTEKKELFEAFSPKF